MVRRQVVVVRQVPAQIVGVDDRRRPPGAEDPEIGRAPGRVVVLGLRGRAGRVDAPEVRGDIERVGLRVAAVVIGRREGIALLETVGSPDGEDVREPVHVRDVVVFPVDSAQPDLIDRDLFARRRGVGHLDHDLGAIEFQARGDALVLGDGILLHRAAHPQVAVRPAVGGIPDAPAGQVVQAVDQVVIPALQESAEGGAERERQLPGDVGDHQDRILLVGRQQDRLLRGPVTDKMLPDQERVGRLGVRPLELEQEDGLDGGGDGRRPLARVRDGTPVIRFVIGLGAGRRVFDGSDGKRKVHADGRAPVPGRQGSRIAGAKRGEQQQGYERSTVHPHISAAPPWPSSQPPSVRLTEPT